MQRRWFAVLVRSRQERVAAGMLDALGIQQFLPLTTELRQWSDRKQIVALPLFPGYLFVHTDASPETRLRVRKVPGIVDFVGNQGGPMCIPESEIEGIRTVLARGVQCSSHPFLTEGDRVRVMRGALAGVEGRIVRSGAKEQLVISVEMIRRSVALSVSRQDVEPVSASPIAARHLPQAGEVPYCVS